MEVSIQFGLKHLWRMTDFSDSDTTLFIGIERELVSWLDSFAKTPHQVVPYTPLDYNLLFFGRIQSYLGDEKVEDFANITECRQQKSQFITYLLPRLVKNYYFIKYEDLKADPIRFLTNITEQFSLIPIKPFADWIYYKQERVLFEKKPIIIPPEVMDKLKTTYPNSF